MFAHLDITHPDIIIVIISIIIIYIYTCLSPKGQLVAMRSDFDFRLSGFRVLGCVVIQKLKALALRRDLDMTCQICGIGGGQMYGLQRSIKCLL
jgi:hypothetical protein